MYRAQFPLQSTGSKVLTIASGDQFTVLERPNNDWWLVQNGQGQVGYVPASYLVVDEAAHSEVLLSIDRAINLTEMQINKAGQNCSKELKTNLQRLKVHRQNVVAEQQQNILTSTASMKRRAPPPPPSSNILPDAPTSPEVASPQRQKSRAPAPSLPISPPAESVSTPVTSTLSIPLNTGTKTSNDCQMSPSSPMATDSNTYCRSPLRSPTLEVIPPKGLGMEMVEKTRCNTGLSYDKSKVAVATVLQLLAEQVPQTYSVVEIILQGMEQEHKVGVPESSDAVRLSRLFDELESVKDDSQQRSWCLHEDEQTICQHLEDISSILGSQSSLLLAGSFSINFTLANPATCRDVLASTGYAACHNLVLYYQMETRTSIRLLLLQAFGSMCALDVKVISELLNSVLPLELARDIQQDSSDIQRLTYSALVLTMIFSTGESVPLQYYDHLNVKFVDFLLDNVESPLPNDDTEMVPDVFVKLILSFNLHFELPEENQVMKSLAGRGTAKTFTEKIMLLFNRADDPVRMFDYQSLSPNSVIKFLSDLYSCRQTANLLYTNDAKVLIDIIVRQLNDLSPGDKTRTDYLSLMQQLLTNSDYGDHLHRQSELQRCFCRISREDRDGVVDMDQRIVELIWTQFPQFFQDSP